MGSADANQPDRDTIGSVFRSTTKSYQKWSRGHKARGQGQGQTLSRPRLRTKDTDASVLQKTNKQRSSKIFFRRSLLEETKKRSLWIFRKVSGVFQRNFNGSNIELSSSRGQGNFRGLETKGKDFKMSPRGRPRGQGRPRGLHL